MTNLNVGSLGDYIREQRRNAQISLRQLAEQAGVSNPYLSQIERGLRKPSADILQQIAKGLRISSEALYVQAGILEHDEHDTEVPAAVRADAALTERQKQVLLDIYESFRGENRAAENGAAAQSKGSRKPWDRPERERTSRAERERRAATERQGQTSGRTEEPPADVWGAATDDPTTR